MQLDVDGHLHLGGGDDILGSGSLGGFTGHFTQKILRLIALLVWLGTPGNLIINLSHVGDDGVQVVGLTVDRCDGHTSDNRFGRHAEVLGLEVATAVPQRGHVEVKIADIGGVAVLVQIRLTFRVIGVVVRVQIRLLELGTVNAINEILGRMGVGNLNRQLLDIGGRTDIFHGVLHINLDVLREFVNQTIALVAHLQGGRAVDITFAYLVIEVTNIVQRFIHNGEVVVEQLDCVGFYLFQLAGIGVEQLHQCGGRGTRLCIKLALSCVFTEVLQGGTKVGKLCADNTILVLTVTDFVQNGGNVVQMGQLGVHMSHTGGFGAVANIQIGVTQLRDTRSIGTVADTHSVTRIAVHTVTSHAADVQGLSGVTLRVDIGDVITGEI